MKKARERVAWTSFWGNLGFAALKITAGITGLSRLLFMDGVFSAVCSVLVIIMLVGLRESETKADDVHRHGHGKAEFIYSALAGLLIMTTGILLLLISIENVMKGYMSSAELPGIFVAIAAIASNLMLYNYVSGMSKELNSRVLADNASCIYFGIFTSSLVLLGIAASIGNFFRMEQLSAVLISGIILSLGIRIFCRGIHGIMDRVSFSHTPYRVHEIKREAGSVKDVKHVRDIKVRRMGDKDMINLEVLLDEGISVNRAHSITEEIKRKLIKNLSYAENVSVNFRPVGS